MAQTAKAIWTPAVLCGRKGPQVPVCALFHALAGRTRHLEISNQLLRNMGKTVTMIYRLLTVSLGWDGGISGMGY